MSRRRIAALAACLVVAQLLTLPLSFAQTSPNWTGTDIGAVAAAGSYNVSGTTITVRGSGADIWNQADEFYYAYRTLAGDGEVTAQVASISNTDAWTKAGVMMRESLAANSRYALMLVTPGKGAAFQYRLSTGGSAAPNGDEVAATAWAGWDEFAGDVLAGRRPISSWSREQVEQLSRLGPEPDAWPTAEPADLPPALPRD